MEKRFPVYRACAWYDGVRYYSVLNPGYVAICKEIFGQICVSYEVDYAESIALRSSAVQKRFVLTRSDRVLLVAVVALMVTLALNKVSNMYGLITLVTALYWPIGLKVTALIEAHTKRLGFSGYRALWKYHSAEHMVLNAHEKLGRVPTVAEAADCSRLSKNCGLNYAAVQFFRFLLLSVCFFYFRDVLSCLLVVGVGLIVIDILDRYGYLRFFQYLYTAPPTERHLAVAVAGFQLWYDKEFPG